MIKFFRDSLSQHNSLGVCPRHTSLCALFTWHCQCSNKLQYASAQTAFPSTKTRARAIMFEMCTRLVISCLRNLHARESARGAWERRTHRRFHLGGHFSLAVFGGQVEIVSEVQPKWNPERMFQKQFSENEKQRKVFVDWASVRIACEPPPWSAQGSSKWSPKHTHTHSDSKNIASTENATNHNRWSHKDVRIGGFVRVRSAPLGASFGPQSASQDQKYSRSRPNMRPDAQQNVSGNWSRGSTNAQRLN